MRFFRRIYYYYFIAMEAITAVLLYPFLALMLSRPQWWPHAHRVRRFWARLMLGITGMRWKLYGREHIRKGEKYIIIANHDSEIDIPVFVAALPLYMGFVGKAELLRNPLLRSLLQTLDVTVDREQGERSIAVVRGVLRALSEGRSMVIFPEGGIFGKPLVMEPFKEGAFMMAVRSGTPLLPISLPDCYKRLPDGPKEAEPGKIRIILHQPIRTEGLKPADVPALMEQAYRVIDKDLHT